MIRLFAIFIILMICAACNSDRYQFSKLEKYYKSHVELHTGIFDSLVAFCKTNHTRVNLKKSPYKESAISFAIYFSSENANIPVLYDSSFTRHDPDSVTLKYVIPFNVIKGFSETIYWAIGSDSVETFFSDEWRVKFQLGTQGDAQYGVLMSKDSSISGKCEKRLSDNVCLTISAVH